MRRAWSVGVAWFVGPVALAGTTYFPGPTSFGTLLFEDLYPCAGDVDFNDVVVRYAYRKTDDGLQDTHLTATFEVVALGATLTNGLALRLPVPFADLGTVTVRVGDRDSADGVPWGAPVVLTPEDAGGLPILWLADDVRAWCGGASGFLNTEPDAPVTSCAPILVDIDFPGGTVVPAEEPFDVFLHRSGARGHQIHQSRYAPPTVGSGAFDTALFGSCHDGSAGARWFVQDAGAPIPGLPFVLNVGEGIGGAGDGLHGWMQERVRIDAGAPRILELADGAGDGDPGWDWYKSGTLASAQFTSGAGGAPPPTPTPTPTDAYDHDGDGWCVGFDDDGDPGTDPVCFAGVGIDDCADTDPTRSPGHAEVWYDGHDADCGFDDDYDQDGDGESAEPVGADCDDTDAAVNTGVVDGGGDGIDDNCDGVDGTDGDGDGDPSVATGGLDCDDGDGAVHYGTQACPATSCLDLRDNYALAQTGYAWISAGTTHRVWCDQDMDDGGWTLFLNLTSPVASASWTSIQTSRTGIDDLTTNVFGYKPAGTQERVRVDGTGWHIDMRTAVTTRAWRFDPCEEDSIYSTVLLSKQAMIGTPSQIAVWNNRTNCSGIGAVYMGSDVSTGAKITIKGVTPASNGAFGNLITWGGSGNWYAAPPSSLGGYQTHCHPDANDVHYRCSGFINDPNWTRIAMYYR